MSKSSEVGSVFAKLSGINVNAHTQKKQNLTYLSWAWAWAEFKSACPDAKYKIHHWPMTMERGDGKVIMEVPYLYDPNLGYMVMTTVTVGDESHDMWLFVMDGANKAMKDHSYTYKVANWVNGKKDGTIDKTVEPATMFDINTTLMRCLVKNLAMFGLGLYIYAGEDLPGDSTVVSSEKSAENELKKYRLVVQGHLAKYDIDFIQKAFADAGYTTKARKPESIISSLVDQVTDRDEMKMIGENIKLATEEANGVVQSENKDKPEDLNPTDENQDSSESKQDEKAAEAKKKADAKIKAHDESKKKAIEEGKANKRAEEDRISSEMDKKKQEESFGDGFINPEGPDSNIKAVKPASHAPSADEIADSVYVDYIISFFKKMIERTLTVDLLSEYCGSKSTEWDKSALDKLFGLYKQLNEGQITLSDAFPKHYEG